MLCGYKFRIPAVSGFPAADTVSSVTRVDFPSFRPLKKHGKPRRIEASWTDLCIFFRDTSTRLVAVAAAAVVGIFFLFFFKKEKNSCLLFLGVALINGRLPCLYIHTHAQRRTAGWPATETDDPISSHVIRHSTKVTCLLDRLLSRV